MRIALITGGSGGLGQATAQRFAEDGMTVVVTDIDGGAAEAVAKSLPGEGHRGFGFDASDEASVADLFGRIEREIGPIAVLMMFAGVLGRGGSATGITLIDQDVADWDKVFAVNARGTFLCLREFARYRRDRPVEHARIVTTSSLAGQMGGLQAGAAYAASKAAVIGLTRTAARELGPMGITVNAIAPGPIDTPMLAVATGDAGGAKYSRLDAIPLRRVGEPAEIAAAAAFLASAEGGFVTGSTIDVNGGLLMR